MKLTINWYILLHHTAFVGCSIPKEIKHHSINSNFLIWPMEEKPNGRLFKRCNRFARPILNLNTIQHSSISPELIWWQLTLRRCSISTNTILWMDQMKQWSWLYSPTLLHCLCMDWCTLQLLETFVMKNSKKCFWSQA